MTLVAAAALVAPAVLAGTVTLEYSPLYPEEITLLPSPGLVDLTLWAPATRDFTQPGTFQTLCLERNEGFSGGPTFDAVRNTAAVFGGEGGAVNGQDPLSVGSAWLYHEFQSGRLEGYNYTDRAQRMADSAALQNAIWWLENEIADPNNFYSQLVVREFGSAAAAMADNNGQIGVAVLNLWVQGEVGQRVGARQDVLICVPDGGLTISLLGAGMFLIGMISRRLRK